MSKTILLELTEKEAALIQSAVTNHYVKDRNFDFEDLTDYENRLSRCLTIIDKVDQAYKSQKTEPLNNNDLFTIVSMAKDEYLALPADLHISNKKVDEDNFKHISLVKAVIVCLNSKGLMKRLADFEFTDHSCDFEPHNE